MSEKPLPKKFQRLYHVSTVEELWEKLLNEGDPGARTLRHFHGLIPANPRCASCYAPFAGPGGWLGRQGLFFSPPSTKNPRYCNACEAFNTNFPGGAEVVLTMLFVDVRNSTAIAERMSPQDFSHLMNRFYQATIHVLVHADAFIDKLVGDEVTALFFPGYAGKEHARKAVSAGHELLQVTGHGQAEGAWIPVGVGVHTGLAWVGSIAGASGETADFTALGDNVNIAARLASQAGAGEVLVSEAASQAAQLDITGLESRQLDLKGKSEPVKVFSLKVAR
jgi:adenylate cyclase